MKSILFLAALVFITAVASAIIPPEGTIEAENGKSISTIEKHYLVKSGVSISVGGIRNKVYVESGGKVTQVLGIDNVVYAEKDAEIGRIGGVGAIVYENQIIGDDFDGGWIWLHDSQTFFWSAETGDWYFYFSFWYSAKVGDVQKLGVYPPTQKTEE